MRRAMTGFNVKLCVSWMDETTINSHMNERQLVDFPRKFEEIVLKLCVNDL